MTSLAAAHVTACGEVHGGMWRSMVARAVFQWLCSVVFCAVVTPYERFCFLTVFFSLCLVIDAQFRD